MNRLPTVIITLSAMACITVLTAVALINDINGVVLASSMTIIGGLGGFTIAKVITRK